MSPVPHQCDITMLFLWYFCQGIVHNLLYLALSRQGLPGKFILHSGLMKEWAGDKVCLEPRQLCLESLRKLFCSWLWPAHQLWFAQLCASSRRAGSRRAHCSRAAQPFPGRRIKCSLLLPLPSESRYSRGQFPEPSGCLKKISQVSSGASWQFV